MSWQPSILSLVKLDTFWVDGSSAVHIEQIKGLLDLHDFLFSQSWLLEILGIKGSRLLWSWDSCCLSSGCHILLILKYLSIMQSSKPVHLDQTTHREFIQAQSFLLFLNYGQLFGLQNVLQQL